MQCSSRSLQYFSTFFIPQHRFSFFYVWAKIQCETNSREEKQRKNSEKHTKLFNFSLYFLSKLGGLFEKFLFYFSTPSLASICVTLTRYGKLKTAFKNFSSFFAWRNQGRILREEVSFEKLLAWSREKSLLKNIYKESLKGPMEVEQGIKYEKKCLRKYLKLVKDLPGYDTWIIAGKTQAYPVKSEGNRKSSKNHHIGKKLPRKLKCSCLESISLTPQNNPANSPIKKFDEIRRTKTSPAFSYSYQS
jgi:hypothetical protein